MGEHSLLFIPKTRSCVPTYEYRVIMLLSTQIIMLLNKNDEIFKTNKHILRMIELCLVRTKYIIILSC